MRTDDFQTGVFRRSDSSFQLSWSKKSSSTMAQMALKSPCSSGHLRSACAIMSLYVAAPPPRAAGSPPGAPPAPRSYQAWPGGGAARAPRAADAATGR